MILARSLSSTLIAAALVPAALSAVTTFDAGTEGWSVSGRTDISPTGGNPGATMDVDVLDVFGADIRNTTNLAFLGDYTMIGALRLTVDVRVDSINFFGTEVSRDLVVELRDENPPGSSYPYVSVWYTLGTLTSSNPGWHTYAIDVADPASTTLPPGWGGTGDEDPVTFEPRLPPGRTFDSVLRSVDSLHFTTFVPGFFYGFTNFEIAVDNVGFIAYGPACPGDLDADYQVGLSDLTILLANFGTPIGAGIEDGDLDGDGDVDLSDLTVLLANFGVTC